MKANEPNSTPTSVRWIRPAPASDASHSSLRGGLEDLAGQLLSETRDRVTGLVALERQLEDRIRLRWEETEAAVRRRIADAEEEILATRRRAEGDLKEVRLRSEKEGRTAGFREGFTRGREEGYRLGYEEGKREGQKEGQREGREEETRRLDGELSGAASALAEAAAQLQHRKDALLAEVRKELLNLAVEIAKKLVKREIRKVNDIVVLNVEKAIDLIFRRGSLVVHVNPQDAPTVEEVLRKEPRWAEGFDSMEVRASAEVSRGGCRLVSGAGTVDMTLETQLSLVEAAIDSADEEPGVHAPHEEAQVIKGDPVLEGDPQPEGATS